MSLLEFAILYNLNNANFLANFRFILLTNNFVVNLILNLSEIPYSEGLRKCHSLQYCAVKSTE